MAVNLGGLRALPVTAEVDRRSAPHRQPGHAVDLLAVADPAQVLAPSGFLCVADKIPPGDVVVTAEFAATQTREVGFGAIGAGAVETVALPWWLIRRMAKPACSLFQAGLSSA